MVVLVIVALVIGPSRLGLLVIVAEVVVVVGYLVGLILILNLVIVIALAVGLTGSIGNSSSSRPTTVIVLPVDHGHVEFRCSRPSIEASTYLR